MLLLGHCPSLFGTKKVGPIIFQRRKDLSSFELEEGQKWNRLFPPPPKKNRFDKKLNTPLISRTRRQVRRSTRMRTGSILQLTEAWSRRWTYSDGYCNSSVVFAGFTALYQHIPCWFCLRWQVSSLSTFPSFYSEVTGCRNGVCSADFWCGLSQILQRKCCLLLTQFFPWLDFRSTSLKFKPQL